MENAAAIKEISAIETSAEIMLGELMNLQAHLTKVINNCRKAKREMEGVSTPSLHTGVSEKARLVVERRNANIYKQKTA